MYVENLMEHWSHLPIGTINSINLNVDIGDSKF